MSEAAATLPGVAFEAVREKPAPTTLRTDIAAFVGRTRRGPIGLPERVGGWRAFQRAFGGLWEGGNTPYAIRGYFENSGEVAYVTRLGAGSATATADWQIGDPVLAASAGLAADGFTIRAASAGAWANGLSVAAVYRRTRLGAFVDLEIVPVAEPPEFLTGLDPADLVAQVESTSRFIRLEPTGAPPGPAGPAPGPTRHAWPAMTLSTGADAVPSADEYLGAVASWRQTPEPALLSMPDATGDLDPLRRAEVQRAAGIAALATLDRMAILDLPEGISDAADAGAWLADFLGDEAFARTLAAYHPWIAVDDPLGPITAPQRVVPPSGHVAGVISRLDRERGAYITPANAPLDGAVDLGAFLPKGDQAAMVDLGINPIRCHSGRGLMVWGGRMLGSARRPTYVAHRRLIHRLVRAVRQVAAPLVFDTNGPVLWLALARGATTILYEAFRAGALKGSRPEQAFRVRCNAEINPQSEIDAGRVNCEIDVAPATPMEFITIRITLSTSGEVEAVEP